MSLEIQSVASTCLPLQLLNFRLWLFIQQILARVCLCCLLTWVLEWKRKRCRYRQGSGSHTILLVYFNGTCASSVSACVHLRKQSVPSFTLCLQTAMHFSSAMKTWNSWDLHNSFQQNLKISVSIQILADIISERELLLGSNEPSGDRHWLCLICYLPSHSSMYIKCSCFYYSES